MYVCIVTLDFAPFRSSGLTIYTENLARGLAERGHSITVIAANRSPRYQKDNVSLPQSVRVIRVPLVHLDWIGLGWKAVQYLRSHHFDFDVVHFADVHFAYAYRQPYIASAFQSFRQRLTSYHGRPYHTNWRDCVFRLAYYFIAWKLIERPSLHHAQHLIMSSQATQSEFVTHYCVNPKRTTVVYPGIDLEHLQMLPDKKTARQRLDLPANVPVLLYIGFSTPRKGLEYLAQALKVIGESICLVIVGQWEKGYQRRFLEALGEAQSLVRLVGYVPEIYKPLYFAASDIFVFPTLLEGFGIPLVEAMAAGLPIVTTSAGAAGEVVGDAGLVVPPGDGYAFASALKRLLNDPVLVERMRQIGFKRARECFDLRTMAVKVEEIYKNTAHKIDPSSRVMNDNG